MVEVEAVLDPESLRRIIAMAKQAPPAMKREGYKQIRLAAEPAAQAARDAALGPVPAKVSQGRGWTGKRLATSTRTYHSGLRAGIAAGVRVGLGSGAYTMGVRITSSASKLRPDQYRMNRTYNQPMFRHPVFGHGSAKQGGIEWFYKPIAKARPEFEVSVKKAMDDVAERLAGL